jgi:hypothetical protein
MTKQLKLSSKQKEIINIMRCGRRIIYDVFGHSATMKVDTGRMDIDEDDIFELLNAGLLYKRGKNVRGIAVFQLNDLGKTIELTYTNTI